MGFVIASTPMSGCYDNPAHPQAHASFPAGGVIYAGIDEAGYGPKLGPLCVAMSVFHVKDWIPGDAAPDLWSLLHSAVARDIKSAKGQRLAIADSKIVKLPNSSIRAHPLTHLEQGVLAFESARRDALDLLPNDEALFRALGFAIEDVPAWYQQTPATLPVGSDVDLLRIRTAQLRRACVSAGVTPLGSTCAVMDERRFNHAIANGAANKSDVTFSMVGSLIRSIWSALEPCESTEAPARLVLDRQGGRIHYAKALTQALPGIKVQTMLEDSLRSRYLLIEDTSEAGAAKRQLQLTVCVEAENKHLPVALASMTAKLMRELLMARFNHYWSSKITELKPTAGYGSDAGRWMSDVSAFVDSSQRRELWRVA